MRDAGLLAKLSCISSVSGGSITSGVLALAWHQLDNTPVGDVAFQTQFVAKIRSLANETLDRGAVIGGTLLPFVTIGDLVAHAYDKHLFHEATLQDLPTDGPEFIFNATSLQTGARFAFERGRVGDYRIGYVKNPTIPLARAVAASSAFPPILSPQILKFSKGEIEPPPFGRWKEVEKDAAYLRRVVLADGGVNDNMALNAVWGKVGEAKFGIQFVSDAGKKVTPDPEPGENWASQSMRILNLIDDQVRNLHARWWFERKALNIVKGAFWNTRADFDEQKEIYAPSPALPCPVARTGVLAAIDTRLAAMDNTLQERLINWGYAAGDAALRRQFASDLPQPGGFPYPGAGV